VNKRVGKIVIGGQAAAIVLLVICFAVLASCEVGTTAVHISAGPTFLLDGSGNLASFTVWAPRNGHKIATPMDTKGLMWGIEPQGGVTKGQPIVNRQLAYGKVPEGYVQTFPTAGLADSLAPGLVYAFAIDSTGATGASGFFYMDGQTPIRIDVPGLCESALAGDVKPLACGTNSPFVEPTDLPSFVRDHRHPN
jgi:hypothetical protein